MIWNDIKDIEEIKKCVTKICPQAFFIKGHDSSIVGLQLLKPNETHIVYSEYGIVRTMMQRDNIDFFKALKKFEFLYNELIDGCDRETIPIFRSDIPNPQLN